MCPCYKGEFLSAGNEYIHHLIHFKRKCQSKHFLYVLFYKKHPFGTKFVARGDYLYDMEQECSCRYGLSHEVCGICFCVRYLLNLKCYKICVEEVPDYFVERDFPSDSYLKKMNCEPFFFLSNKTRLIEVSLNNPDEDKIRSKTDYKCIFLI